MWKNHEHPQSKGNFNILVLPQVERGIYVELKYLTRLFSQEKLKRREGTKIGQKMTETKLEWPKEIISIQLCGKINPYIQTKY